MSRDSRARGAGSSGGRVTSRSPSGPSMKTNTIRFSTFPRTEPPPAFVEGVVGVFRQHESEIATEVNDKGLKSDEVLAVLGSDLAGIGFQVEASKKQVDTLDCSVSNEKMVLLIDDYDIKRSGPAPLQPSAKHR